MSLKLSTPDEFPSFPFAPYDIQLALMRHLYSAIEDKKVTIVESPTGTVRVLCNSLWPNMVLTNNAAAQGKTLSLLCASLSWLKDEQQRARKGELDSVSASSKDCEL